MIDILLGLGIGAIGGLAVWLISVLVRIVICVIVAKSKGTYWLDTRCAEILFGLEPRHD